MSQNVLNVTYSKKNFLPEMWRNKYVRASAPDSSQVR